MDAKPLHPVIGLRHLVALVRRGLVVLGGEAILEAKVNGVLVVAVKGRLYTKYGRKAPRYVVEGLRLSGDLDAVLEMSRRYIVMVEVYSSKPPAWVPTRSPRSLRAYLVDLYKPPSSMDERLPALVYRSRVVDSFERADLAKDYGLHIPPIVMLPAEEEGLVNAVKLLARRWAAYGYEGAVLKLFEHRGSRIKLHPFRRMRCIEAKYVVKPSSKSFAKDIPRIVAV
jgi:hypothetical protein